MPFLQTWLFSSVISGHNRCQVFYRLDSSTALFQGTMDVSSSTDLTRWYRYFRGNGCHAFYIFDWSTNLTLFQCYFEGQWMSSLLQTWLVYSVILRTIDVMSSTDLTCLQRYFEDNGCQVFYRPNSSPALFWAWLVYSVILRTMDVMSSTDLTRLQRYFEDNGCHVFYRPDSSTALFWRQWMSCLLQTWLVYTSNNHQLTAAVCRPRCRLVVREGSV